MLGKLGKSLRNDNKRHKGPSSGPNGGPSSGDSELDMLNITLGHYKKDWVDGFLNNLTKRLTKCSNSMFNTFNNQKKEKCKNILKQIEEIKTNYTEAKHKLIYHKLETYLDDKEAKQKENVVVMDKDIEDFLKIYFYWLEGIENGKSLKEDDALNYSEAFIKFLKYILPQPSSQGGKRRTRRRTRRRNKKTTKRKANKKTKMKKRKTHKRKTNKRRRR